MERKLVPTMDIYQQPELLWLALTSTSGGVIALYIDEGKYSVYRVVRSLFLAVISGIVIARAVCEYLELRESVCNLAALFCGFGARYIFLGVRSLFVKFSQDPVTTIKQLWKKSDK